MSRIVILMIGMLIFTAPLISGDDFSARFPIILFNDLGERFDALEFGAADGATDGIDTAFGEFEIINHPPDGLHAYFELPPSEQGILISYKDIRSVPEEIKFSKEYMIDVQIGSDTLIFKWGYPLQENIVSAEIADPITGGLFFIKLDGTREAVMDNKYLNRFTLRVWYSKATDIKDDQDNAFDSVELFPNPSSGVFTINGAIEGAGYRIFNSLGETVDSGASFSGRKDLSLERAPQGVYFLTLYSNDGRITTRKIILKR